MTYYRLTQDSEIEGTPREKGFVLILDQKKATYYSGVLEPADPPTEEGAPITEPEPKILTLQDLEEAEQAHPADIPEEAGTDPAIAQAQEGTYARYEQDHPDVGHPAPPATPAKTSKRKTT